MTTRRNLFAMFAAIFAAIGNYFSNRKSRQIRDESKQPVKQYEGIASTVKNAYTMQHYWEGGSANGYMFNTKQMHKKHHNRNHMKTRLKIKHRRAA